MSGFLWPGAAGGIHPVDFLISLLIVAGGGFAAYLCFLGLRRLGRRRDRSRPHFFRLVLRISAGPIAILLGALSVLYAVQRIPELSDHLEQWPGLIQAVTILVGAWMLGNLVRALIDAYGEPLVASTESDLDERLLSLADLTAAYLIYALGLVGALNALGVQITAFIASLGIAGLAVALAMRTILSNLFGGIMLTVDRYIQPGQRIRVDEWIGDVERINLHKTTIRTRDNLLVSIPNDVLMNRTIVNYNLPEGSTRVSIPISIAYESDLELATRVIREEIDSLPGLVPDKEPEVNVTELGDSGVQLTVLLWKETPFGQRTTRDRLYRSLLKRFDEEQIEIPYPRRDIQFRDGDVPQPESPTSRPDGSTRDPSASS